MLVEGSRPSPEEIVNANEMMTQREKDESAQREALFASPESKSFDPKSNTLLLNINESSTSVASLENKAKENGLEEKDEFHITVLGFKNGNAIKKALKGLSTEEQQVKLDQIKDLVDQTDWQFSPTNINLHISKEYKGIDPETRKDVISETRESYIQIIHLPALEQFYGQLNEMLGTDLAIPPAHVTLFTGGSDKEKSKMGIGINTEDELEGLNLQTISNESNNNQTEQINGNEWSTKVLENVKDINESQFDPDRTWLATHYIITQPDGTSKEVEATEVIFEIDNKDGEKIEVPAFAVEHIKSLHSDGKEAGSTFANKSLEDSLRLISKNLPTQIPFDGDTAAFEIDIKEKTGTEGVSSKQEMFDKGIISQAEVDKLESVKGAVFQLNLEGSKGDKQRFVDSFNENMPGNLKLSIRGEAIAPLFIVTDKQETTKMFIVIGKEEEKDGSKHNRLRTMAPGRYMDKLPNDGEFIGRYERSGIPEGTSVADLIRKSRSGETLSHEEEAFVEDQRKAQECWWDGGFVALT